jgi:hypothetical protein
MAQAWRVDAGVIRHRSPFDHFALFTLKARLTTPAAMQALFIIVMGTLGVLATQNSNTHRKSIHEFCCLAGPWTAALASPSAMWPAKRPASR